MKKILSLLLALLMVFSLAACGGNPDDSGDGSGDGDDLDIYASKYTSRPNKFVLCYYEGGYSSYWLKAVVKDYMDNVDTDLYIQLKSSTDNNNARDKIAAQLSTYDLYYIEVDMFDNGSVLEELSGLLDMDVPGEEGVKVRDKIDEKWLNYYDEDGKIYQMPATNFLGWSWTYNKTLLDATFGEGNYKVPNTTEELFTMGESLFDNNIFLTAFAGNDVTGGADYLRYCFEIWFAQMTGMEGYEHYFNCEYDNNGTWELAKDYPYNIVNNREAIEAAYQVAQTLCQGRKGAEFIHSKSESLSFLDAQFLLNQGTFRGATEYPIAFYYNGASAEMEMAPYVRDGIIPEQDIRSIKMPVISAIISRTPSINDDATLSAVIDYVDGNAASLPEGVTEEDAAIVAEARNMKAELVCREWVLPSNSQNKEAVLNFMAYLTSNRAQTIAAQNCNGLPVLNYGYVPTEEEMGFAYSNFTTSIYDNLSDAIIVDLAKFDKFGTNINFTGWMRDNTTSGGTLAQNLYTGVSLTADKIYDSTLQSYTGTWKDRIEQALIQNGQ